MNANEIVNALRECAQPVANCMKCKMNGTYDCSRTHRKAAADLIESQAAKIAELNDFQNSQCAKLLEKLGEAERRGRAAVAELDRLTEAQRWIPVAERLPTEADADKNGNVLVWDKDYEAALHEHYSHVRADNCTYWMPFPEPPKGGQIDDDRTP